MQTVCKNRPDKEEVPCQECGKLFATRKHLSEHRRTKHRENNNNGGQLPALSQLPPPAMMMGSQNMGHNLGQYFHTKSLYKPTGHANVLPPFRHMGHMYHPGAPVPPGHTAPPMSDTKPVYRCDVCQGYFPSEQVLQKHYASHWPPVHDISEHAQTRLTSPDPSLAQLQPEPEQEAIGMLAPHILPPNASTPNTPPPNGQNVGSILRQVYHTEHHQDHYQKLPNMSEPVFCDYPSYDNFLYYNA